MRMKAPIKRAAGGCRKMGLIQELKYLRGALIDAAQDHADREKSEAHLSPGWSRTSPDNMPVTRKRWSPTASASPIASSTRAPASTRAGRARRASARAMLVCLLMLNRPEYLVIWLGILRAGGVVALLNTNLTGYAARAFDLDRRRPSTSSSIHGLLKSLRWREAANLREAESLGAWRIERVRPHRTRRCRDG
jgi:hypothetical protein